MSSYFTLPASTYARIINNGILKLLNWGRAKSRGIAWLVIQSEIEGTTPVLLYLRYRTGYHSILCQFSVFLYICECNYIYVVGENTHYANFCSKVTQMQNVSRELQKRSFRYMLRLPKILVSDEHTSCDAFD